MIELPLRLKRRTATPRSVDAWLVMSGHVEDWKATCKAWNCNPETIRLIPLRHDSGSATCSCALLMADVVPRAGVRFGVPYSRLSSNVYIPVDADLFPVLSNDELSRVFPRDRIHIWRSSAGLVSAETVDVATVSDLYTTPTVLTTPWNRAVPGLALPSRLPPLGPARSISLDDILSGGRDDIGRNAKNPSDLANLPRSPNEARPGVGPGIARGIAYGAAAAGSAIAKGVSNIARRLSATRTPGKASNTASGTTRRGGSSGQHGPSWLDRLANSLNDRMKKISDSLAARRNREIERLLHMLDTDPDKGLRFAIPLGGNSAGRGVARPGGTLTAHGTNFSLPGQGAVGPVDGWDIDHKRQMALNAKYRELANRELALGRYRRAAYIFAELLGDYAAAASALRTGRHFREAAVLYRERLNQPLNAATCLENGGLWHEAIKEYESLRHYEKVGDLHRKLGNIEEAKGAFRDAVSNKRREHNYIEAARVCESKLADHDLALETLAAGWPNSAQAEECLRQRFALLNQLDRREQAHEWMQQLASDSRQSWQLTSHERAVAARVLSELATSPAVTFDRSIAVEVTTQLVAEGLPKATSEQSRQLVDALVALAPEDQLLKRDGRRFLDLLRKSVPAAQPAPGVSGRRVRKKQSVVSVDQKWHLAADVDWQSAVVAKDVVFVAGIRDGNPVICRSTLDGVTEAPRKIRAYHSTGPKVSQSATVELAASATGSLVLECLGRSPISKQKPWTTNNQFPHAPAVFCAGFDDVRGYCVRPGGGTVSIEWDERYEFGALRHYDARMNIQSTVGLPHATRETTLDHRDLVWPVPMTTRGRVTYLAIGRTLWATAHSDAFDSLDFDRSISGLASDSRNLQRPVVVTTDGAIYLVETIDNDALELTTSLNHPKVSWTSGGFLVCIGEKAAGRGRELQVYKPDRGTYVYHGGCDLADGDSDWFCTASTRIDECVVISHAGTVQRVNIA